MKFKIGDKVKFIDEMGGGVVTGVVDTKLVKVRSDDGFEMPVLSKDLILDYRAIPEDEKIRSNYNPVPVKPEPEEPDFISEINPWGNVKEEKGVYFAFEPHEQQWLLTGDMDVVIINNTSYELLYSLFFNRDNKIVGVDFSSVPANSKIVIDTIGREEIEDWSSGYLQVLFHSDSPNNVYLPVHTVIDIKSNRFFKEGSYRSNTLLSGRAIIVTIITQNALTPASNKSGDRKTDDNISIGKTKTIREKQFIDKYRTSQGEAIVDLHIGELVDNILGLSSLDMVKIQIDTFKKALNNAIANDYHKITFIHGVGNGVLKSTIIKELEDYEGLENTLASIAKFGVGAIDINIVTKK